MSKVTELASGQITTADSVTVELVEADETPAVVTIRWPAPQADRVAPAPLPIWR